MACRCALVSFLALATPPTNPPERATSDLSSAVIRFILSRASATAASFFRFAIAHRIAYVTAGVADRAQQFAAKFSLAILSIVKHNDIWRQNDG
jgi:hypothetical protein